MCYAYDVNFKKSDSRITEYHEFESCSFTGIHFGKKVLTGKKFMDCYFKNCDLTQVDLTDTVLREVTFSDCKILGVNFNDINEFMISFCFEGCILDFSVFNELELPETRFKNSKLKETSFVGTDLTGAVFDDCDLDGVYFENTDLTNADLKSSYNFIIDPDYNRIKGACFSLEGLPGLLQKYHINIE